MDKDQAKTIVKELLEKAHNRFKQELTGEHEEFLDRVLRQHRSKVARYSWKAAQKWCKFEDDGPVLLPDYARLYYRKGNTEVLVIEVPPQVRLMKFMGQLADRNDTGVDISDAKSKKVHTYSLAVPYIVFLFKFVGGMFTEVRCAFSDRPLKKLDEKPLLPYLSNIDSNLVVCLGRDFDKSELIQGNIVQQAAFVLSHFWQTVYSDEWSHHYWSSKKHFQSVEDARMSSLKAWEDASLENPLFVVEDVNWLKHEEENFGDMVVRMFEDDGANHQMHEELYNELSGNFLDEIKKTYQENFDTVEGRIVESMVDSLADELVEKLK